MIYSSSFLLVLFFFGIDFLLGDYLAGLEFAMQTRVNVQQSSCISLLSAGITNVQVAILACLGTFVYGFCHSYFSIAVTKYSIKSNLRGKGFFWSTVHYTREGTEA